MGTIILFYKYIYLDDPHAYAAWQRSLCESLALKGRILLAHEGINATLGGDTASIKTYEAAMLAHPLFGGMDFKHGDGGSDYFPRLQITVKREIVKLGMNPDLISARDAGNHLSPQETHDLISKKPDNLVILDIRNSYESRIGAFAGAIKAPIQNFRDLPTYLQENKDQFKDKHVLMYCTGEIRCERASAYLKSLNVAQEVSQVQGGIHRYVERYPDGYFRGKNYVFDARIAVKVNDDILTTCDACNTPYDEYTNCINAECNKHIVVCPSCTQHYRNTCGQSCHNLVMNGKVNVRTIPAKISSSIPISSPCGI